MVVDSHKARGITEVPPLLAGEKCGRGMCTGSRIQTGTINVRGRIYFPPLHPRHGFTALGSWGVLKAGVKSGDQRARGMAPCDVGASQQDDASSAEWTPMGYINDLEAGAIDGPLTPSKAVSVPHVVAYVGRWLDGKYFCSCFE